MSRVDGTVRTRRLAGMSRSILQRRLVDVAERLKRVRAELAVAAEQEQFLEEESEEVRLQARDAGALAYLVKPFQKSDLIPAIEVALGRFSELVALEREVGDLAERLEARRLIDRAKGQLMDNHNLTEQQAWRFIQT